MNIIGRIDCKVGIFDAQYILKRDSNKNRLMVSQPYLKWNGNSGSLRYTPIQVLKRNESEVLQMFEKGELTLDDDYCTNIDDILAGFC